MLMNRLNNAIAKNTSTMYTPISVATAIVNANLDSNSNSNFSNTNNNISTANNNNFNNNNVRHTNLNDNDMDMDEHPNSKRHKKHIAPTTNEKEKEKELIVIDDLTSEDDDNNDSGMDSMTDDMKQVTVKQEKVDPKYKVNVMDFDSVPEYYDMSKYKRLPDLDISHDQSVYWPMDTGLLRSDSEVYDNFVNSIGTNPAKLAEKSQQIQQAIQQLKKTWITDLDIMDMSSIYAMFDLKYDREFLKNETEATIKAAIADKMTPLNDLVKTLGFVYGSVYQIQATNMPPNFSHGTLGKRDPSNGHANNNDDEEATEAEEEAATSTNAMTPQQASKKKRKARGQAKPVNPVSIFGKEFIMNCTIPENPNFGKELVEITENMTRILRSFNNCARIILHQQDAVHVIHGDSIEDASAFQIINSINNIFVSFLVSGISSIIQDRIINVLHANKIHRLGKDLYTPINITNEQGKTYFVHSFTSYMTIEKFVISMLTNRAFRYSICSYVPQYAKNHFNMLTTTIVAYIERSEDALIPNMIPVRGVYSFRNGLYFAYHNRFLDWIQVEREHPAIASYMFIDTDFDTRLLTSSLFDEKKGDYLFGIPYIDNILLNQPLDEEIIRYFWFIYGRLLFPLDGMQICLMLNGVSHSGKTTCLQFVSLLVPKDLIAYVIDKGQEVFGLEDLVGKHLVLALDIGKNFLGRSCVFNDRTFNNFVSGESMTVSRKNKLSVIDTINAQFAGAFNIPPTLAAGNLRRIVCFNFSNKIVNANQSIYSDFNNDKPAIMRMLVKMSRSYLLFANHVFQNSSFYERCPHYFHSTSEMLNEMVDPASNFIREHVTLSAPVFAVVPPTEREKVFEQIRLLDWTRHGKDVFAYIQPIPSLPYDTFLKLYSEWYANNRAQYAAFRLNNEWKNEVIIRQSFSRADFNVDPSHLDNNLYITMLIKRHNTAFFDEMIESPKYKKLCQIVMSAGFVTLSDTKRRKKMTASASGSSIDTKTRHIYWFRQVKK